MTKLEFILSLNDRLSRLPKTEVQERLNFYSEMIEDRMEEGLSEEDAVKAVGSVDEIAEQILADFSPTKKQKTKRKLKVWEIVLLSLGSPIWLSLLIAAFAVIFSLYVSLWSVIVSLWAVFGALVGCAFGGIAAGAVFAVSENIFSGIALICAGLVCAGLSILFFFLCNLVTKATVLLTRKIARWVKTRFVEKEDNDNE